MAAWATNRKCSVTYRRQGGGQAASRSLPSDLRITSDDVVPSVLARSAVVHATRGLGERTRVGD